MSKLSLSARVNAFGRNNAKAGNVALSLIVETLQHALATGDGTLSLRLMDKFETAQAKVARAIITASGFPLVRDTKANAWKMDTKAATIAKVKANNEGMSFLADIQNLAAKGETLLGKAVADMINPDKPKAEPKAFAEAVKATIAKQVKAGKMTDASALADLRAIVAELEAKVEGKVSF